jgi:DNA-binding transcriptional ArsR family regulator
MKQRAQARAQVAGKQPSGKRGAPKPMNPAGLDFGMLLANARQASELLKALSHEVRLLILCFLIEGEKSVGEIEKMLDLRQPAVSQQLARLRADGLVETRRNGKSIYYSLARSEVRDVIGVLHDAFCKPRKIR